jgi:hypothetical protein
MAPAKVFLAHPLVGSDFLICVVGGSGYCHLGMGLSCLI